MGEFLLAQLSGVLQISPSSVPVDEALTQLGLDSLLAVELRNRIEKGLGISVPVVRLLQDSSVATLGAFVLEQVVGVPAAAGLVPQCGCGGRRRGGGRDLTARELLGDLEARGIHVRPEGTHLRFRAPRRALTAEDRSLLATHKTAVLETLRDISSASRDSRALSANQLSIWLMHAIAPESTNYHIGFAARVLSEVNVASLHAACQALVDRHAVLRTTYRTEQGEPVQDIRGYLAVDFVQMDAAADNADQVMARVVAEHRKPFDLERGPVFRVRLFTRAEKEHMLLVSLHHIAADGWSVWMLADELRTLYRADVRWHGLHAAHSRRGVPKLRALAARPARIARGRDSLVALADPVRDGTRGARASCRPPAARGPER